MVWGCISAAGTGELSFIKGNMKPRLKDTLPHKAYSRNKQTYGPSGRDPAD